MPRIHCLYLDCNFLDNKYCSAPQVEIDPDLGCATYIPAGEEELLSDSWEDEDDEFDESFDDWDTEELDDDDDDDDDDDFIDGEDDW